MPKDAQHYAALAAEVRALLERWKDDPEFDLNNAFAAVCKTLIHECDELASDNK